MLSEIISRKILTCHYSVKWRSVTLSINHPHVRKRGHDDPSKGAEDDLKNLEDTLL